MRIVAGTAKGRALQGPKAQARPGEEIRPTADRVRESLFNVLGQYFEGGAVLDLYAGTGALAFEALSRGMSRAILVDSGAEAQKLCLANAQVLGFASQVELMRMPAARALSQLARSQQRFALIFADPPYKLRVVSETLSSVEGLLEPQGILILEHDRREDAPESQGALVRTDQRAFGDTRVSIYRFA